MRIDTTTPVLWDVATLVDHPLLHCIQMAYSAAERVLEMPPVDEGPERRVGMDELAKWLSDASAAVAVLRASDRATHEATRS